MDNLDSKVDGLRVFSSCVAFATVLLTFFVFGSVATLLFSLFVLAIGHLYVKTINKKGRKPAALLFNIVFSLITLFAVFHYLDTVVDYGNFAQSWRDEFKFWNRADELASYSSLLDIFKDGVLNRYFKNQAYYLYIGGLGYIANTYFDGNNLLLQFMGSALWGGLIPITVYKIFLLYFDRNSAFKKVLWFSLFSVVFSYSFLLMRDIIITFFYTVVFYIILKQYSVKGLIQLILVTGIIWFLRFQHGAFCLIFILFYIYKRYKKNKIFLGIALFAITGALTLYFYDTFTRSFETLDRFGSRMETGVMEEEDSMTKYLFALPPIVKEITVLLYTQARPFPSWNSLKNSLNSYAAIVNILPIIYAIFWYVIVFSIIKWAVFRKAYKQLSKELRILLLITLFFLLANTMAAVDLRRIMCVYPFIYLIYQLLKKRRFGSSFTKPVHLQFSKTNFQAVYSYLFIVALYLFFKG